MELHFQNLSRKSAEIPSSPHSERVKEILPRRAGAHSVWPARIISPLNIEFHNKNSSRNIKVLGDLTFASWLTSSFFKSLVIRKNTQWEGKDHRRKGNSRPKRPWWSYTTDWFQLCWLLFYRLIMHAHTFFLANTIIIFSPRKKKYRRRLEIGRLGLWAIEWVEERRLMLTAT